MKKITIFYVLILTALLQSCYAFLRADKIVYAGTVAKKPVEIVVDTAYNTEVIVDGFNK